MGVDGGVEDEGGRVRKEREESLDEEEGAAEVGADGVVEGFGSPGFDRLQLGDAGVQEKDVELSEGALDLGGEGRLVGGSCIGGEAEDGVAELLTDGRKGGGAAGRDGDAGSFGDKEGGRFRVRCRWRRR